MKQAVQESTTSTAVMDKSQIPNFTPSCIKSQTLTVEPQPQISENFKNTQNPKSQSNLASSKELLCCMTTLGLPIGSQGVQTLSTTTSGTSGSYLTALV